MQCNPGLAQQKHSTLIKPFYSSQQHINFRSPAFSSHWPVLRSATLLFPTSSVLFSYAGRKTLQSTPLLMIHKHSAHYRSHTTLVFRILLSYCASIRHTTHLYMVCVLYDGHFFTHSLSIKSAVIQHTIKHWQYSASSTHWAYYNTYKSFVGSVSGW